MKKHSILTSILIIVMCLSLTVGGTFALFTSQSEVNIAVTSGTVSVIASVDADSVQTKKLYDTKYTQGKDNMYGGEITFTQKGFTLEKFLPGDGVKFDIVVKNESDVTVQYRTIISCVNDNGLFAGLKINIGEHSNYNSVKAVSTWEQLSVGSANEIVPVEIQLPENAGNEYQNKTCTISYVVEAVQGNANTVNVDAQNKTTAVKNLADANGNTAKIPVNTSIESGKLGLSLEIEETTATVNTGLFELAAGGVAYAYNVNIPEVAEDNETAIVLTMNVQKGLDGVVMLFHDGVPMTLVDNTEEVDKPDEFYYDTVNGVVTFATKNFSNFTIASGFNNIEVVSSATTFDNFAQFIADGKNIYLDGEVIIANPESSRFTEFEINSDICICAEGNATLTFGETTTFVGEGSLTICGGAIVEKQELCIAENVTLIIERGTHTFNALSVCGNGKIIVNDGTLNCKGSYAGIMGVTFAENGSLIVNGGALNMYQPFNLNHNRCDNAYIEINGGTIDMLNGIENLFVVRNVMDKDREEGGTLRGSSIRVNGGIFIAHYEVDYAGDANAFIRNGDYPSDTNKVLVNNAEGYDCVVTGGTFYGSWQRADNQRYTNGNGANSDGKFVENSIAGFVADGYEIIGDADNGYVVIKK